MIGILTDQHMRDQRLGRQAALDNARRRRRLDRRRLAGATAVAWAACHEDAERGWHDIEAFGDILADDMQRAATAGSGASPAVDIHDLLDPLEMGGKPAPVGITPLGLAIRRDGLNLCRDAGQRRLGLFEGEA